ncbi:hypothetical protein M2139_002565 [Enterococcus sp. PF1-24]|uniref:competence type IV pilus minor pilin ComGG n=1 Tax=unclassified Enterococcus TaxID=2608891 RepID=UPI0024752A51|nr:MULTISPECIES: competence type IV pilus minor pilin ComGG [unclassified Enterococcus]MDH6365550.1 hypothetical protein [Enterococcus sp. PFB1-1]MDH6402660.1 hypothetical protein [Enterococcus sp. PF1-24]
MKLTAKGNGFCRGNNQGGLLLTTLMFLLFFSTVFIVVYEDYQLAKEYYVNSRDLYLAKTMKEMFLTAYYQEEALPENPIEYTTGKVSYTEQTDLIVVVEIDGWNFTFHEPLREVQKETENDTDLQGSS